MTLRFLLCHVLPLIALAASFAPATAEEPATQLEYTRLDLTDGRRLRNVAIRTYDSTNDRFLLVADRKAMTVSASLIPAPIAAKLKIAAPRSGTSVSAIPTSPASPPPQRPPTPSPAPPTRTKSDPIDPAAHRTAAIEHAENFYRYEFKVGSDAIRVTSVRIDASAAKPIAGWPNRCRTEGKASLEIFDTKGWSATRATSTFEIVTEKKSGEPIAVIDFTRKT